MGQAESELEYTNRELVHGSYYDAYIALLVEQLPPEAPTDVPIVVPIPLVDATFPCCPGCEVLNKPVTELIPIEEDHPITLPHNNQGQAARMATVHSGQHAHCGGCSDH